MQKANEYPTLTVVFEDRSMKIFFTHPDKINMSLLNRMQQMVIKALKTEKNKIWAELRKQNKAEPVPVMAVQDISTIEKPIKPVKPAEPADVLDAIIEDAN